MEFQVTEQEAQIIINALANMPYGQVFELITKLQKQGIEQIKKKQAEIKVEK